MAVARAVALPFQSAMALILVAAGTAPAPALASKISGEVGIYSKYLDYDLFVLTDEPVVQAGLYAQVSEECTAMAWGSHGTSTSAGGELDVGVRCQVPLGKGAASAYALRSFLRGYRDSWTIAAAYHIGGAEMAVEHFLWDGHPSGTRISASYRYSGIDKLTLKPVVAYETGLGVADMLAAGLNAEYALTGELSLVALGLVPLVEDESGFRQEEFMVGLRYGF